MSTDDTLTPGQRHLRRIRSEMEHLDRHYSKIKREHPNNTDIGMIVAVHNNMRDLFNNVAEAFANQNKEMDEMRARLSALEDALSPPATVIDKKSLGIRKP